MHLVRLSFTGSALIVALAVAPARADLAPGDIWSNPNELPGSTPLYTDGLPSWYTGTAVHSLLSDIFAPPPPATPFFGSVLSEVYYVNGTDASGGLGFVYRFNISSQYPKTTDGLERASFAPDGWAGVRIINAGSDNSGISSPKPAGSSPPPDFASWSDGDPLSIQRDPGSHAPEILWGGVLGGTFIAQGQHSALIWFETDARFWTTGFTSLIDGGDSGSANILVPLIPEPASALLAFIGLTTVVGLRRRMA